ncbi:hypothetical protein [Marinomonas ostreistagni]|uniref:hypothetical protein n=1 Tax=Marinomonas ostreistagni TaxID=359209 RepID=UPI00194F7FD6|nr:hypothetical protein [Marinomonas ostreistagni]MBM6549891.1 hypothetical protein [Marinomonas ostreistagni]
MKYKGLAVVLFGILSGCSTTEKQLPEETVVNQTVQYEVGKAESAIGNVKITLKPVDGYEQAVTVNFDKAPYKKAFNLCENTRIYDLKDSVSPSSEGINKAALDTKKLNCDSWVKAKAIGNDKFFVSYKIKVLKGYEVEDAKGRDVYLPEVQEFKLIPTVFTSGDSIEVVNEFADGKAVKSSLLEINL